jgi:hypothetical protein
MNVCSVEGCGGPHRSKGYCDKHYQRFLRHGGTDKKKTGIPSRKHLPCSFEGCKFKQMAKGYCQKHYSRWRKHGDSAIVKGRWNKVQLEQPDAKIVKAPVFIKQAFNLFNIWNKKEWPYATVGKEQVCEMIMEELLNQGYYDLSFLSLPAHGREIKQLADNGFDFNYNDCLGVEHKKAKSLREFFKLLFKKGELGGVIPIVQGNIDKIVTGDQPLPTFNAVHLDYNGPLTASHLQATEAALKANPDALPFVNVNPELLFYQPYRGIKGAQMETYCLRNQKVG